MRKLFLRQLCAAVVLGFVFQAHVFAQTFNSKPGTKTCYRSNGFYEYLPVGYEKGHNDYPLIIFFHGLGEIGNGTTALSQVLVNGTPKQIKEGTFPSSFKVKGETFSFIVLIPQFWAWPDVSDVESIIDYAEKNYRIDRSRIYLTGLSMGGQPVWDYAAASVANAMKIAAIVPVCGVVSNAGWKCDNIAQANLPVWATHNQNDPQVSSLKTVYFVDGINKSKYPPTPRAKMTLFASASHDAWTRTYDLTFREDGLNVYEWMLSYQRRQFGILDVQDLKFSGRENNGVATLAWTTSAESKNLGFSIERSYDGARFDSIGFVPTVGDQGGHYSFADPFPVNGKNFYRLKIISVTGQSTYSTVIGLDFQTTARGSIFPNPVRDIMNLQLNFAPAKATLRVFDMSGRSVFEKSVTGAGNHSIPLNLPRGTYNAMLIENGRTVFKQSFIKQ